MASSLQNAFTRTLGGLSTTSSFKKILSHGSLYLGILIYTALGAKVGKKKIEKSSCLALTKNSEIDTVRAAIVVNIDTHCITDSYLLIKFY